MLSTLKCVAEFNNTNTADLGLAPGSQKGNILIFLT